MYIPRKDAARNALDLFIPIAGTDYASGRNFDHGPGQASHVSRLSPWVRNRILTEWDILSAVLEAHPAADASKFIDEVCWRTYWKGWLQLRPGVWTNYVRDRATLLEDPGKHIGYKKAIKGETGIDCFDAWNTELIENNYLHNHARMWYASLWVHTLKLPWQLGADWFLRHLLDGDPASNTLSWRWVAGLHTPGKAYLARRDNIRKYTNNRFTVDLPLAEEPVESGEAPNPSAGQLRPLDPIPSGQRLGLLVADEDLSAADWLGGQADFAVRAGFFPLNKYVSFDIAPAVTQFRKTAMHQLDLEHIFGSLMAIVEWAEKNQLDCIVMPEPTVGPTADILSDLNGMLRASGIGLHTKRHWWDDTLYPHATHGFFRFQRAIPKVLAILEEDRLEIAF